MLLLWCRCGGQCDSGSVQQEQPVLLGLVLWSEECGEVSVHGSAATAAAHAVAVPGHAKRPLPFCLGNLQSVSHTVSHSVSHESGVLINILRLSFF